MRCGVCKSRTCPVLRVASILPGMKRILLSFIALASSTFAGDFAGETGLQLYSLRDSFKKDVDRKSVV